MGKKKDKKKGHGAEKTAAKTDKKLSKKDKKELAARGEDDIETILGNYCSLLVCTKQYGLPYLLPFISAVIIMQ